MEVTDSPLIPVFRMIASNSAVLSADGPANNKRSRGRSSGCISRIMTLYGPGDSRCCMHQSPTRPCTCAVPGPVIDLTGNDADSVPGSSSFGDLGRDPGFLDKEGERERCGYSSRRQRV